MLSREDIIAYALRPDPEENIELESLDPYKIGDNRVSPFHFRNIESALEKNGIEKQPEYHFRSTSTPMGLKEGVLYKTERGNFVFIVKLKSGILASSGTKIPVYLFVKIPLEDIERRKILRL